MSFETNERQEADGRGASMIDRELLKCDASAGRKPGNRFCHRFGPLALPTPDCPGLASPRRRPSRALSKPSLRIHHCLINHSVLQAKPRRRNAPWVGKITKYWIRRAQSPSGAVTLRALLPSTTQEFKKLNDLAQRQRQIGLEVSKLLKDLGLAAASDDEATIICTPA
jgi:hypothetical protein